MYESFFHLPIFARAHCKNYELAEEFAVCRYHLAADVTLKWTAVMRKPANDRHRRSNNFRGAITTARKIVAFLNVSCYLCCSSTTRHSSYTRAVIMAHIWTSRLLSTSNRRNLRASMKVRGKCQS